VRYYREVQADDPFRNKAAADADTVNGPLFHPVPTPRRMRLLIDVESLAGGVIDPIAEQLFEGLAASPQLQTFRVFHSEIALDGAARPQHERPYDLNMTASSDPSEPSHDYAYVDDSGMQAYGLVRAATELTVAEFEHHEASADPSRTQKNPRVEIRRRAALNAELARDLNVDLVIAELPTTELADIRASFRANTVTRTDAIAIIGHFLRTQRDFRFDDRRVHVARTEFAGAEQFYGEAILSAAPGLYRWQTLTTLAAMNGDDTYSRQISTINSRLGRALRARDYMLQWTGSGRTAEAYNESAEAFDRMIVYLNAALDMFARSVHYAAFDRTNIRNAEFDNDSWFSDFKKLFPDAVHLRRISELRTRVRVLVRMRNTIHAEALASLMLNVPGSTPTITEMALIIPDDAVAAMTNAGGQSAWGLIRHPIITDCVVADLVDTAHRLITSTLAFIDEVATMLATTEIPDREPILAMTVPADTAPKNIDASSRARIRFLTGLH
jgi:hypothetical protein